MGKNVQTIRYGMYIMPFHNPAKPPSQCYDEDLELIVRAEELGFTEFWIGEHHTMKYENIVMPEIFIGRALGATKTIRMGPAPVCIQQHHPAHVAGRRGFQPFGHCLIPGNVLADCWNSYEDAALEAGRQPDRSDWKVARSIFLADTTQEARERARTNSLGQCFEYIGRLFDKGLGRKMYKRDLAMSDADCNLDYLMTEQIIAGDVDEVLRRLLELMEETGTFGTLILMGYDWDDKPSWLRSMELFGKELMPALNKAVVRVGV